LNQESLELAAYLTKDPENKDEGDVAREKAIHQLHKWAIPVLIIGVFAWADIKGGQYTFAGMLYEPVKLNTDSLQSATSRTANAEFSIDMTQIDKTAALKLESAKAQQTTELGLLVGMEQRTKSMEVKRINGEFAAKKVEIEAEKESKIEKAKARRDAKIEKVDNKVDKIKDEDTLNKQSAHRKADHSSWLVTVFGWVLFLLMVVRLSYLLNKSGIKRHIEFSELDAEGSWLEKLKVVVNNAGQRQWHRVMVGFHRQLTKGTAVMARLDGSVRLQNTNYNAPTQSNTPASTEETTSESNDDDAEDVNTNQVPATQEQPDSADADGDGEEGRVIPIEDADGGGNTVNPNEFIETETGLKTIGNYIVWLRNAYNGNSRNRRSILAKRHAELNAYIDKHLTDSHPTVFEFASRNRAIVGEEIWVKLYRLRHRSTPLVINGE